MILLVGLAYNMALAQTNPDEVRAWVRAQWAAADSPLDGIAGSMIDFRLWEAPKLTKEQIAELEKLVEGKPDHPARQEIKAGKRQLASGGDERRYRVWANSATEYRISEDTPYEEFRYIDVARAAGVRWQMVPVQLQIGEGEAGPGAMQASYTAVLLGYFRFGGFNMGRPIELTIENINVHGTKWDALARSKKSGLEMQFTGRWDPVAKRGFVERVVNLKCPAMPEAVGNEHRFDNWVENAQLGAWIAGIAEERTRDGAVKVRYTLDGVTPYTAAEFDALTRLPSVDRADPVREATTYKSVYDYRPGAREKVERREGGEEVPVKARPAVEPSSWLRYAGWGVLSIAAVLLIVLRLRRSQMA
ncbi:MAG: hypothetical protein HUU18_06120 [Phycisphaerales bacterium]|nr:hypothetical protein [Phycisphaerales bacterium]